MSAEFSNVYEDKLRADSYSKLEFPGTYYLAFRDLPAICREHVVAGEALDFGCGTGRSTRFLRALGYDTLGVDISAPMLDKARELDPEGEYLEVPDGDLGLLPSGSRDLVLAAFTFDNIPTLERKTALLAELARLLRPGGRVVNVVSTPEIYVHEWLSFSTRDFPENRAARSGDAVRIVMLDVEDRRPVEDVVCSDADYRLAYRRAGLELLATHRPLGRSDEPFSWVNEKEIAPWAIYLLARRAMRESRGALPLVE